MTDHPRPLSLSAFAKLWHCDAEFEPDGDSVHWVHVWEPLDVDAPPDARPGLPGGKRWGLTQDQLAAVVRGQMRQFTEPTEEPKPAPGSPDGKTRLRGGGRLARRGKG